MAPSHLQHRRTYNLLLISKLLNQRDAASPFTLVLDSLEQSAGPLVREYLKRANVRILLGFTSPAQKVFVRDRPTLTLREVIQSPNGICVIRNVEDTAQCKYFRVGLESDTGSMAEGNRRLSQSSH